MYRNKMRNYDEKQDVRYAYAEVIEKTEAGIEHYVARWTDMEENSLFITKVENDTPSLNLFIKKDSQEDYYFSEDYDFVWPQDECNSYEYDENGLCDMPLHTDAQDALLKLMRDCVFSIHSTTMVKMINSYFDTLKKFENG